jgi:hypothetical protein
MYPKNESQIKYMKDRKTILSTLWIFVTLNYLYCDLMSMMNPEVLNNFLSGDLGFVQITQEFLLGSAVLMEIPISLVLLSRVLKHKANRIANIIAGTIMTAVQSMSLFLGTPELHYTFFSIIEISTTAFIVWYAWNWKISGKEVS